MQAYAVGRVRKALELCLLMDVTKKLVLEVESVAKKIVLEIGKCRLKSCDGS